MWEKLVDKRWQSFSELKPSVFSFVTKRVWRFFIVNYYCCCLIQASLSRLSPCKAPLCVWKGSPCFFASGLEQYYHILFYFSKEVSERDLSAAKMISDRSHVSVDCTRMRCFKCCGIQPWTSCGLLINRENKILFMALFWPSKELLCLFFSSQI